MRTTYIIDPEGIVQQVYEKVKPSGHSTAVLAFLRGD